jgi:hypothetical protein
MPSRNHTVSEADWLGTVGDTLDLCGWSWIHHRPARRAHGKWETPTQGSSAKGWPDVFAVRGRRAIALELKTATGRVTAEQTDWLEKLRLVGVEAHLIRLPQDWDHFTTITAPDPEQLTSTTATTSNERKEPR